MEFKGKIESASLIVQPHPPIGIRLSYPWATNPLSGIWTDSTATATVVTNGTTTRVAGGAFNQNNSLSLSELIGVGHYTMTLRTIVNAKSASSFGLAMGIRSVTSGVPTVFAHYRLADTEGYISFTNGLGLPDGTSVNNDGDLNFIWDIGDVLELSLERRGRDINIRMINTTNSSVSELTYNLASGGVGNPFIYFYGGDWSLTGSFVITYEDPLRPELAAIGDSITWGSGAESVASTWFSVASQDVAGGAVRMAAPVEQSIDGVRRLDDIIDWVKPKNLLIAYGVNDLLQSVTTGNFDTRIRQIVTDCQAAGINPILLTLFPQDIDAAAYNAVLFDIASDTGCSIFDIYTLMKDPSGFDADVAYRGDSVHPNRIAHIFWGQTVGQYLSPILTQRAPVVFGALPNSYNSIIKYLGLNKGNKLVSAYGGSDTGYIFNRKAINIIEDAQDASIFINGRATFTGDGTAGEEDFIIVGNSGTLANPNFKVQAGVTNATSLVAGTFLSGNFNVTASQPGVTGGNFQWSGNAANLLFTPYVIMVNNADGNGIAQGVTIDTNTTPASAGYIHQRWRTNGSTVATIFRDGNAAFNSSITSGVAGSSLGSLLLSGNTSGTITIRPATVAGTWTLTLPTDDGTSANQPLITDGSGVTSWGPIISSGTWTPTLVEINNLNSQTPFEGQYTRIGSEVTGSFKLTLAATTETLQTELSFTLPVASNFTESGQLGGTGGILAQSNGVTLYADVTNNIGIINFVTPIDTSTMTMHVHFTYQIL